MKANELRIGNYVAYEDDPFTMSGLSIEGYPILDTIKFGYGVVEWNDLKPIPLTQEHLVKFGFEFDDMNFYKLRLVKTYSASISINLDVESVEVVQDDYGFSVECKFIHQLQNLYFALTGEELKISSEGPRL